MHEIALFDKAPIQSRKLTSDGYLAVSALVARTGIQEYRAYELGDHFADREPNSIVRVYRPESEVFSADSMASYAFKPVTNNHPTESVKATNWADLAKGAIGGEVVRDGHAIRVNMLVMDGATVADIDAGKRELSAGYMAVIDATAGTAPDGQAYDAVQRNIRINHVAVVDAARGGPELVIPDSKFAICDSNPNAIPKRKYMEHLTFDGVSVPLDDAKGVASLFAKVTEQLDAFGKKNAALEKENAEKDDELDKTKKKVMSDSEIDALVADRAALIATVAKIDDAFDCTGKAATEIRKAIVTAKFGDAMADKSDDYIAARFDLLADAKPVDAVADAIAKPAANADLVTDARAEYLKSIGVNV